MPTSLLSIGYVVCFPLATCPSPVLWAYASATITEFNDVHCSGDFSITSTGCTCFRHNNCGQGDISAITLLISSLSEYNPVNILWYTAPVHMMTFRWSHRSYQSICQHHPPYSHPQVTLIYYSWTTCSRKEVGSLGTVPKSLEKELAESKTKGRTKTIHITAMLISAWILWIVRETWVNLLSLRLSWYNTS